jgi:hypothetical protein
MQPLFELKLFTKTLKHVLLCPTPQGDNQQVLLGTFGQGDPLMNMWARDTSLDRICQQ